MFGGGTPLWTTDASKYALIYEIRHGTEREQRFAPKCCMEWATFSPDGENIITASSDKSCRIFDPAKGVNSKGQLKKFRHPEWVRSAVFNSDATLIATACDDGNPRVWDIENPGDIGWEIIKYGSDSERPLNFVAFSDDDEYLVTSHWDRFCRIWDVVIPDDDAMGPTMTKSNTMGRTMTRSKSMGRTATGRQAGELVAPEREPITEPVQKFKHPNSVLCARLSPDNSRVCTASGTPRFNGLASVYDLETGEAVTEVEQEDCVTSVSFSPDEKLLCTSCKDRTAQLIDLNTQLASHVWHHPNFLRWAEMSPDGRYVVTACDDGQARIFCTRTKAELVSFGHVDHVTSATFRFDGTMICTASQDGAVRVFGPAPRESPPEPDGAHQVIK